MKKIISFIFIFTFIFSGFSIPQLAYADPIPPTPISITGTDCGVNPSTWFPCLAEGASELIYKLTSFLVAIVGIIFDAVIAFSLDSTTISGSQFINDSWGTIRDVSNIAFIFILLYISIATILQISGHGIRELLVKVIIMALLVNFSLFITKAVIDSSNILAIQFTNGISVNGSISAGFVDGFSPQKLIGGTKDVQINTLEFITVFSIAAALNIVTMYAFFVAGIIFVARLVALYFIMIVAPLAFIAWILPNTRSFFNQWWSLLFKHAFVAPIFLFMFWIILQIAGAGLSILANPITGTTGGIGASRANNILKALLNSAILITALLMSVKIAKSMSGSVGTGALSVGKKIGGFATGVATGGAAFALRQSAGRGARYLAQNEKVKNTLGKSRIGAMAFRGIQKTSKSSLDVRATKAGGWAGSQIGAGKAGGKGGYDKYIGDQIKKEVSTAKTLGKVEDPKLIKEKNLEKNKIVKDKEIQSDLKKTTAAKVGGLKETEAKHAELEKKLTEASDFKKLSIETDLRAAKAEMKTAQAELNTAKILEKNGSKNAQDRINIAQDRIKQIDDGGKKRQKKYADVIESRTIDTGYLKVARKDKEAANLIRADLNQSGDDRKVKGIIDALKESAKDEGNGKK